MYLCQFFLSSIENIVCHNLRQHRTIPALRLKHRSGSCGTASALPKCSIMSGCGTRHRASGAKASRTLRPLPLLRFAVSATGGAHLCSIQYYLRFWLGICRTSLAVSALRIMRYCPYFHPVSPHSLTIWVPGCAWAGTDTTALSLFLFAWCLSITTSSSPGKPCHFVGQGLSNSQI